MKPTTKIVTGLNCEQITGQYPVENYWLAKKIILNELKKVFPVSDPWSA